MNTYGTVVSDPRYVPTKPTLTAEEWQELSKQYEAIAKQYDATTKTLSASKPHQSSPQQLLEWLEGRPVTDAEAKVGVVPYPNIKAFSRELVGDELRAFIMKDGKRTEVYAFRIVGGEFGSSGAETVVNLLSTEDGYEYDRTLTKSQKRELAEVPEAWDDEWISKYVPTSHVERITVGGTAFFAPEEENK